MLSLILEHRQVDIKRKHQQVSWIMIAANTYFFAQVGIWASFMLLNAGLEDRKSMNKVEKLDTANKFSPAIVLVISVLLFRCRFNGKQSKKVFAREKVIVVHVVLFLSFVFTYATFHILSSYYIKSPFGSMQECRLFVSSSYF